MLNGDEELAASGSTGDGVTAVGPAPNPSAWYSQPRLRGTRVLLEPLTVEHSPGYLAAAGEGADAAEVFRWLRVGPPTGLADARAQIADALTARARGERFPYAQLDASTGAVVGTTSLYDVNPDLRTLAIGDTWLGRAWWHSGLNTEAKLLLLTYAFDALGAVRVVWHTDGDDDRGQNAVLRLGARREGILRKHRIGRDGTWRDTAQFSMTDDDWPAQRSRLAQRLHRG